MKILIHGINYLPELTGIGKYTGEMVEWLVSQGHEVHVVTAPPYYPEWSVLNGYSSWRYKKEVISGAKVWRCPLWIPTNHSGLKRIFHLMSFALSSFPVMLRQIFWRPDIIFVIEPPLFCSPTALLVSKLSKSKSWLHIQDFEVDAAFDLRILTSKRLRGFVLFVEKWLMSKFDVVSTISTQMLTRLDQKGDLPAKQVCFPNWVDGDQIFPIKDGGSFRKELDIKESNIVALYSGNMGEKQGLEIVIEAARSLRENGNILFVMCGSGAALSRLQKLADGLSNMLWLPLQPVERLNDLLNMADIHLLPQRVDAADLVMPSKLTGMLASGRPILSTVNEGTQVATVLEKSGIIVPPGDLTRFSNALVDLVNDKELRVQLGENARQYAVEHLGLDTVLGRFEQVLHEIILEKIST